jgi:hypothetical protein
MRVLHRIVRADRALWMALVGVLGCASPPDPPRDGFDAGGSPDAHSTSDAADSASATGDGDVVDAELEDAAVSDGGSPDSDAPDASLVDAAEAGDSASLDAAPMGDAFVGTDAFIGTDAFVGSDAGLEACSAPGMYRTSPCPCGGTSSEHCVGGYWVMASECPARGECAIGAFDVEMAPDCYVRQRVCDGTCHWGTWMRVHDAGECNAGTSQCGGIPAVNCLCTPECTCDPVPGCGVPFHG